MLALQLSVLTLNVWGVPLVASNRKARIEAIGVELNGGKYDIVALQELWSQADSQYIQKVTASVLPYTHYFHSGVMGAGLLVLSKYPILNTLFHAWSLNGYFHRIQHADWFGGKGVGLCRILVNDQIVHLYNAHLHAEYDNENDEYKTHRVIQAFESAQFIEATRGNSALQILAGDLNTQPQDLSYKILLLTSKMTDSCNSEMVCTNASKQNSYTSKSALSKNPHGIRIDHIFVRSADHLKAKIIGYKLPLPDRVPGQKFSYSDHEAVLAEIELTHNGVTEPINAKQSAITAAKADRELSASMSAADNCENTNSEKAVTAAADKYLQSGLTARTAVLMESITLCETALKQLKIDRILYYSASAILFVILVVLVEFSPPIGLRTLNLLLKFIVFGVILFCLFMGSIWNFIERNGVLQGKKSMEIKLQHAEEYGYSF